MLVAGVALLASTMLGMGHDANAAEQNSKLTVTNHQTTYYTSKDLKTKRTAEPGKVFRTNGTVTIKGNRYYRIYQDKFAGYIRTNQVKPLVAKKMDDQYVVRKNVNVWNNLYWTSKKAAPTKDSVYKVKYSYTLGNGVRYYSLYKTNKQGESEWCGYTHSTNAKLFKATNMDQKVTVTKDNYNQWKNLYFTQTNGQYKKGQNYTVKRYYDLNGERYYSLYQTNKQGKSEWCGYINNKGVRPLKAVKVEDNHHDNRLEQMTVTKNVPIYKNLYLTQTNGNTQKYVDKAVTVLYQYTFGNNKKYASVYSEDGSNWLGYVDMNALTTKPNRDVINSLKLCMKQYQQIKEKVPAAVIMKESLQSLDSINAKAEKLLKDKNATYDDYYDLTGRFDDRMDQCGLNMTPLNDLVTKAESLLSKATGAEKTALEKAIKEGKTALTNAQTVPEYQQYYNAAKVLNQAIQAVK